MAHRFVPLFLIALTVGCAGTGGGLGSMQKTTALHPGMTPPQVVALLGQPARASLIEDSLIWKYTLHEMGRGFVPCYLLFDGRSQRLERWFADEAEYARQQASMMRALQPLAQALQPPPPPVQPSPPAASQPPQPPAKDSTSECEKRYRFREDALCECHQLCGVLPSFPP